MAHLAAIVESCDDGIISKSLDGVIRSWNGGAERIFGWSAAEAIGRPITLIIPPERHEEERRIIDTLKRGERLEHFETTRVTKALTGYGQAEDQQRAREAGFDDHVVKPVNLAALERVLAAPSA